MRTHVVIAGAGPTGLMLACELRLAGVEVLLLDRADGRSGQSRAGGLHARTLEILDQRGIVEEFLRIGRPVDAGHFAGIRLDLSRLDTRYPYVLALVQTRIEALLEQRAAELGVRVGWSAEVTGLAQDDSGVTVHARGFGPIRADYLVGCDGGRSTVRGLAGIGFTGTGPTVRSMLADVELRDPPAGPIFQQRRPEGDFSVLEFEPGWYRLMTNQFDQAGADEQPVDFAGFRDTFLRIAGTDYGMHRARWVSRYGDAARLADRYRAGRILLAGDAAHIHWPAGGQGLNTGVQDAVNLGWKLAAAVRGTAPDGLLATYETERRPVADRVLRNTRAQAALSRPGPQTDALRDTVTALLAQPGGNDPVAAMITGLDLGERAPGVPLHRAQPVLLGAPDVLAAAAPWADRVELRPADDPALPVRPLLVRPDGLVAWSGKSDPTGGSDPTGALRTWFGSPARVVART
jgi:2-polyprenyl-6-methoxyphenol hydroxylase-like FAD-dependent oxidoreductase